VIGQLLGHYLILEKIGAGGMGDVYRAQDAQLDRHVALKVLLSGSLSNESARNRFRKEALVLAKLNHPNIETVFEFNTQNGVDFLVMELIEGQPLNERLKQGALLEGEVLRLGMQFAEGLSAAHEQKIIHRDLKPSNLMITLKGQLKILDFGLATLVGAKGDQNTTAGTTQRYGIPGTLPYMAPEQLRGSADLRSDLYSAGVVLYEMATGRRPFQQSQEADLIGAILFETPVPPSSVNPRVSSRLESIILKALEKDPAHRYQSARELLVALDVAREGRPAPEAHTPVTPSREKGARSVAARTIAAIRASLPSRLRPFLNVRTAIVLLVVLAWAAQYRRIESSVPWLLDQELNFYHAFSRIGLGVKPASRVLIVAIDDSTFWSPPLSGAVPTNRRYLGELAKIAADGGALVVGIDFRLNSTSASPGDDDSRKADNEYLLESIWSLANRGVPVVLTCWLTNNGKGEWRRQPLIFADSALPGEARVGHLNIPLDPRNIPLRMLGWEWDDSVQKNFNSFAMQIVNAYDDVQHTTPRMVDNAVINAAMAEGQFVSGGFRQSSVFHTISARDLSDHRPGMPQCCVGQIVLIGGTWHEGASEAGRLIESFPSPVGMVPGIYMHANYVEALIEGRYKPAVPEWLAVVLDFGLMVLVYYFSSFAHGIARLIGVLSIFLIFYCAIYVLSANVGLYLTFMAPLMLCFVQLPIESLFRPRMQAAARQGGASHEQ
jgi:serine/threonine protein kinase